MKAYSRPEDMKAAIHILPGDVRLPGARKTVRIRDALTWGPCSEDLELHLKMRKTFLCEAATKFMDGDFESVSNLGEIGDEIATPARLGKSLSRWPLDFPVIIWTSGNCGDRVLYWWALNALRLLGLSPERCWIAESVLEPFSEAPLSTHSSKSLELAFASVERLTRLRLRSGASLWRKFSKRSPRELDVVRARGGALMYDVRAIETLYYWGLPVVSNRTKSLFALSELDKLLLGYVSRKTWVRPIDIFVRISQDHNVRVLMNVFGDNALALRLRDWAGPSNKDALLRSRAVAKGHNWVNGIAYQLTDRGKKVLQEGLDDAAIVPVHYIGGVRAYDRTRLWVRHVDSDEFAWSVVRLRG